MNSDLAGDCAVLLQREQRQRVSFKAQKQQFDPILTDEEGTPKLYISPKLRQIGSLSRLVMGLSGLGVDSQTRREF